MPPIKVLIVDDEEFTREFQKLLFYKTEDISVIGEARSGMEAVEKVTSNYPDVILMDVDMPILSGFDTARLIKKHFPNIKILMYSPLNSESEAIKSLLYGADGYLSKDCSNEDLKKAIRYAYWGDYALDHRQGERQLRN